MNDSPCSLLWRNEHWDIQTNGRLRSEGQILLFFAPSRQRDSGHVVNPEITIAMVMEDVRQHQGLAVALYIS